MPTNYTGRVLLILFTLWVALSFIFPGIPGSGLWFADVKQKITAHPNLKPGIDMVGGTSLVYEIKPPEGSNSNDNLAERVMESLKKRVDPDGVRNLVWRPQGNTRLEIQMPLTGDSDKAKAIRKEFDDSVRSLNATNVRVTQVTDAVENLKGDARRDKINELAMGSKHRAEIFGAMASAWDQIQQAHDAKNSSVQADKEDEYDKLKSEIEETNIQVNDFQNKLDSASADQAKYGRSSPTPSPICRISPCASRRLMTLPKTISNSSPSRARWTTPAI